MTAPGHRTHVPTVLPAPGDRQTRFTAVSVAGCIVTSWLHSLLVEHLKWKDPYASGRCSIVANTLSTAWEHDDPHGAFSLLEAETTNRGSGAATVRVNASGWNEEPYERAGFLRRTEARASRPITDPTTVRIAGPEPRPPPPTPVLGGLGSAVPVTGGLGVCVANTVLVGVIEGVRVGGFVVAVCVGVCDGVLVNVGVYDGVLVAVLVAVALGESVPVGVFVGVFDGVLDGVFVGVSVGVLVSRVGRCVVVTVLRRAYSSACWSAYRSACSSPYWLEYWSAYQSVCW